MQSKTTRAFRTISEAAEELDLQPHVLRFWESKFPNFKPIKRGGGRRFYRPEDIEFLRGIKILLHDERHPIKDVQKLIRVKGANRVVELGRSIQKAAIQKDVKDTDLVPDRIKAGGSKVTMEREPSRELAAKEFADETFFPEEIEHSEEAIVDTPVPASASVAADDIIERPAGRLAGKIHSIDPMPTGLSDKERSELELALTRLLDLRRQWDVFKGERQ